MVSTAMRIICVLHMKKVFATYEALYLHARLHYLRLIAEHISIKKAQWVNSSCKWLTSFPYVLQCLSESVYCRTFSNQQVLETLKKHHLLGIEISFDIFSVNQIL